MEQKPRAKVQMGAEPSAKDLDENLVPPSKPVAEMNDEEKAAYRKRLLQKLEEEQSAGGQATYDIVVDDPDYKGTITMRRPTLDQQREIGVRAAKYLQGVAGVDLRTDNLALFFATFDVCVDWDSAPEWFQPRKMYDYRLLEYIYGRWAEWLKSFREFVPESPKGDSQAQ
jgi:hypothetical protein